MTTEIKQIFIPAFETLKAMGAPVYVHVDDRGNFSIDAEDGAETETWADYYSQADNWLFGVNPKITQVLDEHRLFAEWVNPGRLSVYKV